MLRELVYTSRQTAELSADNLELLLDQAIHRNALLGVTGVLIYHYGRFLQLLEGDADVILNLYDAISRDDRHTDLNVAWTDDIAGRCFDHWSMGFVNSETLSIDRLKPYANLLGHDFFGPNFTGNRSMGRELFLYLRDNVLKQN